jgi:hypothetical protein
MKEDEKRINKCKTIEEGDEEDEEKGMKKDV